LVAVVCPRDPAAMSAAELTIDRAAPVTRTPLGETAWVEVATGFVRDAEAVYDEPVAGVGWQQSELLRYDTTCRIGGSAPGSATTRRRSCARRPCTWSRATACVPRE
jgi:hypothetical protein